MDWLTGIRGFIEEKLDDLRDWYDSLTEEEEELELFDNEEIEQIQDEIEELEQELESIDEETEEIVSIPEEETIIEYELSFPDWIDTSTQVAINEELGISDYSDMTDSEKDEYVEGWRGFEDADYAAGYIDSDDMSKFRDEIQAELDIPGYIINQMTDDELLQIITIAQGETISIGREILDLQPDVLASEFGMEFRGTFESWETFIQSNLYEFIRERPDLFEVYITDDGEIEIYETYTGD